MNSKKLTWGLLAIYLLALTWVILLKLQFSFETLDHLRNINLIPFGDSAITNGTIDFSEIIYNTLAFIPFGIFLCVLGQRKSLLKMVGIIFLTSLSYEILQYIFAIGGSDITDLIANTLGGVIGIGIFFFLLRIFKEKTCKIINIVSLIAAIFLILLIAVLLLVNA